MRELLFVVPPEWDGGKLKSFLRGFCRVSSTLLACQKQRPDGILRNGTHAVVTETIQAGDHICLRLSEPEMKIPPVPLPLSIVWEDDDLLVVDKPPGMPVYPTPGHDRDSLANAVSAHYQATGQRLAFHPIYRLDKDTSGLLVLAKHAYGAAALAVGVEKEYTAICEGDLQGEGTVSAPIRRKDGHGIQREVGEGAGAQHAVTHWKAVGWNADRQHTLLKLRLETGRTHQIRVHISHLGHPLAGDDFYGGSLRYIARQALLCSRVQFSHPVTGEPFTFTCPLPEDMQALLNGELHTGKEGGNARVDCTLSARGTRVEGILQTTPPPSG